MSLPSPNMSSTNKNSSTSQNSNSQGFGWGKSIYGNTTTNNPYVTSQTNNGGTTTNFAPNSALSYVDTYMSKNIGNLIDDFLNPNPDSATNQALIENYKRNLSNNAREILNNDIIAPLANRNMIRSSQATNLYSNLSNNLNNNIADYTANLIANSQNQGMDRLATLYNMYMNGYNVVSGNQAQSLNTSQGNATNMKYNMSDAQGSSSTSGSNNTFGYGK